jgi:hypothetical protein
MSDDVQALAQTVAGMDASVSAMQLHLTDMRQSFELMEQNIGRMGADVNHMSEPMRLFNWMNPLR